MLKRQEQDCDPANLGNGIPDSGAVAAGNLGDCGILTCSGELGLHEAFSNLINPEKGAFEEVPEVTKALRVTQVPRAHLGLLYSFIYDTSMEHFLKEITF